MKCPNFTRLKDARGIRLRAGGQTLPECRFKLLFQDSGDLLRELRRRVAVPAFEAPGRLASADTITPRREGGFLAGGRLFAGPARTIASAFHCRTPPRRASVRGGVCRSEKSGFGVRPRVSGRPPPVRHSCSARAGLRMKMPGASAATAGSEIIHAFVSTFSLI